MQNHDNLVNGNRPAFHFMSMSATCRKRATLFNVYAECGDGISILLGGATNREDAFAMSRMVKVYKQDGIAGVRIETNKTKRRRELNEKVKNESPKKRRSFVKSMSYFRLSEGVIDFASLGLEENI